MNTFQKINMISTTFNDFNLEDYEKKKGIATFSLDYNFLDLQIEPIQPVLKAVEPEIEIYDRKKHRSRKNTELF